MAKNYIKSGVSMNYTPAGADAPAGVPVVIGNLVAVPTALIKDGEEGVVELVGEWAFKKEAALVITKGDKVFWDNAAKEVDKTGSNTPMGVCSASALAGDATVRVRLDGISVKRPVAQADFAGADLAAVKVELNAFLVKLRNAGSIDT